ncbi:MAG: HAMP domain-containing protein [Proteobacteria bacterium]|nr:MAG: HAMP domain-containing protein [Pseudomonadota bacterium]
MTIIKKKWLQFGNRDERKRFFEIAAMLFIALSFVALSRLEGRLFDLSKSLSNHPEFFNSVVYFGLININVVLILILCFLLFRNIIKLVLERRHGVIGSRLRTKLVLALVFFALAPTALLFYISTRFLTESFETWFSTRVEATMHRTREAGAMVYDRDQRRLASLSRIALQRIQVYNLGTGTFEWNEINPQGLKGFAREYKVSSIRVYDQDSNLIWHNESKRRDEGSEKEKRFVVSAIQSFSRNQTMLSRAIVDADEGVDIVRGVAPIVDPRSQTVRGVVVLEERFETQILQSVETIIQEFASLKPGAELIRISYVILLVLMAVIIIFSATWFGFYVARGIIAPIQRLADATREVALGNYGITLEVKTDDETGQLFRAFNSMTFDLQEHEQKVQRFTAELERTNEELDRRRKYMEIILKNIAAGVLAVDSEDRITSVNPAAEKLLGLDQNLSLGRKIEEALDPGLVEALWKPIKERVQFSNFSGEIDLSDIGINLTLLADATRFVDENNEDYGVVIVIDDASEQVKVQRVAAWREVARRIAHEIKNPLTPIKISAQRLLRKFGDQFEGKDHQIFESCIGTIVSEVDALRDLVNEFSKFSRLPSIKTRPEDLTDLLHQALSLFNVGYEHIEFETAKIRDDMPLVPLDREQMIRVFTNIITNAIASIPEDREKAVISISARLLEDVNVIRIEIADNGSGIPEALKQRVLEPYFSTKKEGTGLGLAIVNQIISDHGGYLRIQDNQPVGTVVVIELPMFEVVTRKRINADV